MFDISQTIFIPDKDYMFVPSSSSSDSFPGSPIAEQDAGFKSTGTGRNEIPVTILKKT